MKHFPLTTLILIFFSFLAHSCSQPAVKNSENAESIENRNIATVKKILAAMDSGDYSQFDALCAKDYQINNPFLPVPGNLEVFKGLMQGQKTAFPDVKHEVVQIFAKENMVCVRGIYSGTNTGSMQGNPPSGNRVVLPFIFTDEFDGSGKLKIRHVQFDTGAFNAQLSEKKEG